jgi:hypothetical protein
MRRGWREVIMALSCRGPAMMSFRQFLPRSGRAWGLTVAAAIALTAGVLVVLCNGNRAQKRVRKHFAIPDKTRVTEATIRDAILAGLPLGSSEDQVYGFLKKCGIGKDKFSSFYPLDGTGKLICRINLDPGTCDIVHTHYGIFFRVEADKGFQDVEVQEWYTGP